MVWVDVVVRGRYYPDRSLIPGGSDPPIHLHITANTEESVKKAEEKIGELLKKELNPSGATMAGRNAMKIPIPSDTSILPGFGIRSRIVGPAGQYVKHIAQEAGCRVQIRGRGSQFLEQSTGKELDEPIHLWIQSNNPGGLDQGRRLCEDLIATVKAEFNKAVMAAESRGMPAAPPPPPPPPPTTGSGAIYDPAMMYYGAGHMQPQASMGYDPQYAAYYQQYYGAGYGGYFGATSATTSVPGVTYAQPVTTPTAMSPTETTAAPVQPSAAVTKSTGGFIPPPANLYR